MVKKNEKRKNINEEKKDIFRNSHGRPLTQEELARLAERVKREGKDIELEGTNTFRCITVYGHDGAKAPEISLRPILDDTRRETVGWEIVSSHPFTFGLNVRTVTRAPLPERHADVPDELDGFLPPSAALDDVVEVANPPPVHPLRRRSRQLVKPEWVFPPDERQAYKPSATKKSAHSLVGKLKVWIDDPSPPPLALLLPKSYVGSAALVAKSAILTASHMIPWLWYDLGVKFKALFVPAYYDGKSVFTRADGSTPAAWCHGAYGYSDHAQGDDIAVWHLSEPLGMELGYFGYKTYTDDWEDMPVWRINGYPVYMKDNGSNNGERPARVVNFPITDDDDDGAGVELEYKADTSGGMSGGPVWGWFEKDGVPKPYIIGTHSGGEDNFLEEKHNLAAGGPALSALIKWARDHW